MIFKRQGEQARSMRDTQRNESRTQKQPVSEVKGGKSLKKEVASSSKCSLRGHEDKAQERLVSK